MEKQTEIKTIEIVTISGKTLPLEQIRTTFTETENRFVSYQLFGASCSVSNKEHDCEHVKVSSFETKLSFCKILKKELGVVLKPSQNAFFKIHKSDYEMIKALEEEFKKPMVERNLARKAAEDAMPRISVYYSGLDWGDYSITSYSEILKVRELAPHERNSHGEAPYRFVETVLKDVTSPETLNIVLDELANFQSGKIFTISDEQFEIIKNDTLEKKRIAEEIAENEAQQKAENKRLKLEKEELERKEIEKNELFLWDAGVFYSSAGNRMLHSLGAIFSEKDNNIQIYTTTYASYIPNANTTYSIKEFLKENGFSYDAQSKKWTIPLSEENAQKVIDLLKQYDTKVFPETVGMQRCWECGSYSKKLDESGYCGC